MQWLCSLFLSLLSLWPPFHVFVWFLTKPAHKSSRNGVFLDKGARLDPIANDSVFCQCCLFRKPNVLLCGGFPPTATCCALLRQKSESVTGGLKVNTERIWICPNHQQSTQHVFIESNGVLEAQGSTHILVSEFCCFPRLCQILL